MIRIGLTCFRFAGKYSPSLQTTPDARNPLPRRASSSRRLKPLDRNRRYLSRRLKPRSAEMRRHRVHLEPRMSVDKGVLLQASTASDWQRCKSTGYDNPHRSKHDGHSNRPCQTARRYCSRTAKEKPPLMRPIACSSEAAGEKSRCIWSGITTKPWSRKRALER